MPTPAHDPAPIRRESALGAVNSTAAVARLFPSVVSATGKMRGQGELIPPHAEAHARWLGLFAAFEHLDGVLPGRRHAP
jgi:hypothetical protein